ncbi:TetR/AcrR family transcriptional regulator [Microbacteriaceae bacterium VKM Ac-2854]|nr:TetR/AcrR family transcriptional regulator [Microbacteriaceae bacterium VKM Ac-2854]
MPEPARPPRRDAARNRSALIEAGRCAFAQHGLGAALEPIAAEAGVGIATLYRHFPSRTELWEAVLAEPLAQIEALVQRALAVADPWQAFAGYLHEVCAAEASADGMVALMTTRFDGAPGLLATRARIQQGAEQLFQRAQDAGAIRTDASPTDLAFIMLANDRIVERLGTVAPDAWRRALDLALDGLRTPDPHPLGAAALKPNQIWRALMRGTR